MKNLRIIVSVLVMTAFSSAFAQTAVPPPPRPADNGPSLAVTMQFIQDKMNDTGTINFVSFWQNTTDGSTGSIIFTEEQTKVVADPNQCRISFHLKQTRNGVTDPEKDINFPLRDVQNVVVEPLAQLVTEMYADGGKPNIISTSTNPPVTALINRLPHGRKIDFDFIDADLADRVAKALVHAVELCSGGSKEPF
jgi:hypothetical protein